MAREQIVTSNAPPPSGAYSQGFRAGGRLADAVRVGVYLSDLRHFNEMNAEYLSHFKEPLPARTTIQSDLVGFDVEIDAVISLEG